MSASAVVNGNGIHRSTEVITDAAPSPPEARRNRLPDVRPSTTHKFTVGSHEGYLTVGLYPDGRPGEIFITMAKEGSTVSGLINSFAQAISIGLQYGVPLKTYCEKYSFTRFEPSGWTGNPEIPQATSVMDYIFRWLHKKFYAEPSEPKYAPSISMPLPAATFEVEVGATPARDEHNSCDAPSCKTCGSLMRRNGSCYVCGTCGWTSGCS
jgi:ribonucleoside-diphosphate reductase alpha chain